MALESTLLNSVQPSMSTSSEVFAQSILDAENLLRHFNTLNTKPPPPEIES
jgi:hypothetical protein